MSKRGYAILIIAALSVALFWFVIFGGEVFGTTLEKRFDKLEFNNFLAECPTDEVRLFFCDVEGRELKVTLNFSTRTLSTSCNENVGPCGLFWIRKNPYTNTITSALAAPPVSYTDNVLTEIKQALDALPEQEIHGLEFNQNEVYFAFWRGETRVIYHCSKGEAQSSHAQLIQRLGLSSL